MKIFYCFLLGVLCSCKKEQSSSAPQSPQSFDSSQIIVSKVVKISRVDILSFPTEKSSGMAWDSDGPADLLPAIMQNDIFVAYGDVTSDVTSAKLPLRWNIYEPVVCADLKNKITISIYDYEFNFDEAEKNKELIENCTFYPKDYETYPDVIELYGDKVPDLKVKIYLDWE